MRRVNKSLLEYARKNRVGLLSEARGVCLYSTLQMAHYAREKGLDKGVTLLRWRLKGDPDFREHWALGIGGPVVLDLTAVQVDGSSRLLRKISDYPVHFGKPRPYPLELALRRIKVDEVTPTNRLPLLFQIRLRLAFHIYDLKRGNRTQAVIEILQMPVLLALGALNDWASARLASILHRCATPVISKINNRTKRGKDSQ